MMFRTFSITSLWRVTRLILIVGVVRLRFLLAVGTLLAIIAGWPFLRIAFDTLTTAPRSSSPVSGDTEYWCPMCPGVISEWPAKCPVCNMALVRRQKGEMTPLPDGVVARVQLSPYRMQLAGIRTSPVEFRRLEREVAVSGLLELSPNSSAYVLNTNIGEPDASALTVGQRGMATADLLPDDPLIASVLDIAPASIPEAGKRVRIRIDTPHNSLRQGVYVSATFRTADSSLESSRRVEAIRRMDHLAIAGMFGPEILLPTLLDDAVRQAAAAEGLTLCVPEMSVIDTGKRRIVYTETMPGVYDAVEVRLGRRCGDHYPVRAGLEIGQRVVTTGSILLDAESRLNPQVAAGYFGAGNHPATSSPPSAAPPSSSTEDDNALIARQKICPVTGEPLGSMGAPVRVSVAGKSVFICCKGCEKSLLKNPAEHLSKIPR